MGWLGDLGRAAALDVDQVVREAVVEQAADASYLAIAVLATSAWPIPPADLAGNVLATLADGRRQLAAAARGACKPRGGVPRPHE